MSTTKINELPAAAGVASNDYLAIDNTSGVSQKITAAQLVNVDNTLSVAGRPADAKATGDAISAESAARQSADTSLNNAIVAETSAREQAVSAEASARETADTALNGAITAEATAREAADAELKSAIEAEATAREAADNELMSTLHSYADVFPDVFSDLSKYNSAMGNTAFVVSDTIISNGAYIYAVRIYATSASPSSYIYVVNHQTSVVMKRVSFSAISGWNTVVIDYQCAADCVIGFYAVPTNRRAEYAANPSQIKERNIFSHGLRQASPLGANEGDTLTITATSTNQIWAIPMQWFVSVDPLIANYQDKRNANINSDINAVATKLNGFREIKPTVNEDVSWYTTRAASSAFFVSDRIAPMGSFIDSIRFYASEDSARVYIYAFDASTYKVQNVLTIPNVKMGWNIVSYRFKCPTACVLGVYGNVFNYKSVSATNVSVREEYVFSYGIYEPTVKKEYCIGDTVEIDHYSTNNKIALPIQWNISLNPLEVNSLYSATNINSHKCIISFIDDDTGQYVPDIWGSILEQTGIKMGFACVTGFISGLVTPVSPEYAPMSVAQLRELYANGHDVYSHSYSHPAFYENSTTLSDIATQCFLSKEWLNNNGFTRNSDIIVYPGGMNPNLTEKMDVVGQYYKYGVTTVFIDGINPEPLYNPYQIVRFNADTGTIEELKSVVDKAVATNKMLVFMTHAYQLNLNKASEIAKIISLIEYIQNNTDAEILPLSEALHRVYGWH